MSYCRIGRLGNSSITFYKTRQVFAINGGPRLRVFRFIGTADYKDSGTLKSCHKEFRLIPLMRLLYKSRFAKHYFAICFSFTTRTETNPMKEYWELFLVFFKIGAFTFGGGYAMIPLIRNEVVNKRNWLEDEEFMDTLAISQSIPGPMALNTALFVGNKRLGFKGSLFSGLGIILPSFIAILLIAIVFTQFKENPVVERIFKGIRPAVVALIASPLLSLGKSARISWKTAWIPVAVALSVWLLHVSPVYIVLAAISLGILHLFYVKQRIKR